MSDIHLGSKWSKAREANRFLKYHTCDTLILCGDVIDGWELLRGRREKWKRRHTNFIRRLLDIQHDTHIIYLRGNHDAFSTASCRCVSPTSRCCATTST